MTSCGALRSSLSFVLPDEATADTESVFQAAMRLMDLYERFLVLAERARGLAAPSDYSDLLNNCARLPDTSLEGFHNFIDRFVGRVAEMPAILIAAGGGQVEANRWCWRSSPTKSC